jgi:hypothetical protein
VSLFVFGSAYVKSFLTIGVHICTDLLATYFENGLMKWPPSRVMVFLVVFSSPGELLQSRTTVVRCLLDGVMCNLLWTRLLNSRSLNYWA